VHQINPLIAGEVHGYHGVDSVLRHAHSRYSYFWDITLSGGSPGLLAHEHRSFRQNSILFSPEAGYHWLAGWSPDHTDISENYWGASVTAAMDAADSNGDGTNDEGANISVLNDYYDDVLLPELDYDGWAHSAYPLPRITEPYFGTTWRSQDVIPFTGWAWDWEDSSQSSANPLPCSSLSWRLDDEDGPDLDTGCTTTFTGLSSGTHRIWLVALDSDLQEGKVYVDIHIE
jgi:hypothetical protein